MDRSVTVRLMLNVVLMCWLLGALKVAVGLTLVADQLNLSVAVDPLVPWAVTLIVVPAVIVVGLVATRTTCRWPLGENVPSTPLSAVI